MPEIDVFDSVKASNLAAVEELLKSGANVNQADKNGWTPLNWAAGKGNLKMVQLLIDQGADVFKVGIDQRTAYMIALAAGHADVAKLLRQVEDKTPGEKIAYPERKYCKAYHLKQLRPFPSWTETEKITGLADDAIVYLHQDYRVTRSMWNGENIIFDQVTPDWKKFCSTVLGFKVPDDYDLIIPADKTRDKAAKAS